MYLSAAYATTDWPGCPPCVARPNQSSGGTKPQPPKISSRHVGNHVTNNTFTHHVHSWPPPILLNTTKQTSKHASALITPPNLQGAKPPRDPPRKSSSKLKQRKDDEDEIRGVKSNQPGLPLSLTCAKHYHTRKITLYKTEITKNKKSKIQKI